MDTTIYKFGLKQMSAYLTIIGIGIESKCFGALVKICGKPQISSALHISIVRSCLQKCSLITK